MVSQETVGYMQNVGDRLGTVSSDYSKNAKDVTNTMSQDNSQTSTDSAEPVQQKFHLDLNGVDVEYSEVKCPNCKKVTPTQWIQIPVGTDEPGYNPLSLLSLRKRLTLCQNCGNLRLVK